MTALMAGDVSDRPQGLTGCHLPNDKPQYQVIDGFLPFQLVFSAGIKIKIRRQYKIT
jgi:hypothetical protein